MASQTHFDDQAKRSNPEFWSRFGSQPAFRGARVLEMAKLGAHVVAVDTDDAVIRWAQEHVAPMPVAGSLEFVSGDVTAMGSHADFDYVISKDTFEHIDDLSGMLVCLHRAMKPSGELWAGFSPLYYSPYGDHGRTGLRMPWAHALLPSAIVYPVASRHLGTRVRGVSDLGLNAVTLAEFRQWAAAAGLAFNSIRYNCGSRRLMPVLSWLRRYSFLVRYVTVSIYAVLVPAQPARP